MRILIIDEIHPSIFPMLESIGMEADYRPEIKPLEVCEALAGFDGLIVRSKMRITAETLKYADKLKFVARAGAGDDQPPQQRESRQQAAQHPRDGDRRGGWNRFGGRGRR